MVNHISSFHIRLSIYGVLTRTFIVKAQKPRLRGFLAYFLVKWLFLAYKMKSRLFLLSIHLPDLARLLLANRAKTNGGNIDGSATRAADR